MSGRPTSLTADVQAKICEALQLGVSWKAAAAHGGVSEQTVIRWRERGESGEEPFCAFLEAATRARDSAEVRMAAAVVMAVKDGDARAAMWWLERRRPATWGQRVAEEVTVKTADPNAQVAAALAALAAPKKAKGGAGDGG